MNNLNKLPKWAQQHIKDLERQKKTAIRALNEYLDSQTESSFYIDDLLCTGEQKSPTFKRRYIQAYKMTIEHENIKLQIYLKSDHISLQWNGTKSFITDIGFIPTSYQSAKLISKNNMR